MPSSALPLCNELTMPAVTVLLNRKGLPKAATNSPARMSSDGPSFKKGNLI